MKAFARIEGWFAVALIVFFFLPWVNIGGLFTSSGFGIPDLAKFLPGGASFLQQSSSQANLSAYLVYIVPILAVITLARVVRDDNSDIIGVTTGVMAILIVVLLWAGVIMNISGLGTQSQLFSLGIGAYLTVITGIGMIFASVGLLRLPQRTTVQ